MLTRLRRELLQSDPELGKNISQIRQEQLALKKKMVDQPQPLLRDLWIPNHQNAASQVVQPPIAANNFELKPALITMVQQSRFGGSAVEDPHEHITTFLEYCNTLKQNGVPPNSIRLQLFPFSLRDSAKIWLHTLPPHLKDTWDHLLQAFFERYFPPTRAAEFRDQITRFTQYEGESLYDAWNRYQNLLRMCPHHGLEKWLVLQTFYKGLTSQTRASIDSAAGGGIMNKTLDEVNSLIESMASHHFQWNSERAVAPQKPGMYQLSNQDALAPQLESLTKQIAQMQVSMSTGSSSVASVQSAPYCGICGSTSHFQGECSHYLASELGVSEVNYAQNQGPFSQSYNPAWKNHPNLSYRSNPSVQSLPSTVSNQNFNPQGQQMQYNGQRQMNAYGNPINVVEEKLTRAEDKISKLSDDMASIKEMLQHLVVAQATSSSEARLPSQVEPNPKNLCGAIKMEGRIMASSICFLIVMLLASPAALAKHDLCELRGKSVCIAKSTAGEAQLQAALDYACGHGADCSAIQPGAPCFNPDTRLAHASYTFNDYYQRQGRTPSACDFAGAGVVIQKKCKPIHFESQGCTSRSCNLDCFAKNPDKILARAYCTHKHDLHYCHCLVCKRSFN